MNLEIKTGLFFEYKSDLKGQHILAQGIALGKIEEKKTVRVGKMKIAENLFRTELHHRSLTYKPFRPQMQFFFEKRHRADDFIRLYSTQGVALG